jgi:hypothetical protein
VETQNTGTGGVRPKKENKSNREGNAGLAYFLDTFFLCILNIFVVLGKRLSINCSI